jgi:hypothetical protein
MEVLVLPFAKINVPFAIRNELHETKNKEVKPQREKNVFNPYLIIKE